jgi:hypothetical protein
MSELGPAGRALLDAARDGDEPTRHDELRVRAGVARRLLVGAAVAGTSASTVARAAAAIGGSAARVGVAAKAVLPIALIATVGVEVARSVARTPPAPAPAPLAGPAPSPSSRLQLLPRVISPGAAEPAGLAPTALPTPTAASLAPPIAASLAPPTAVPLLRPTAAPAPSTAAPLGATLRAPRSALAPSDVEAEVSLLGDAQHALQARAAARALALLEEHARRYPSGALGEEREATRVAALCALGRAAEAGAAADRFLLAFPGSPLTARVRRVCSDR